MPSGNHVSNVFSALRSAALRITRSRVESRRSKTSPSRPGGTLMLLTRGVRARMVAEQPTGRRQSFGQPHQSSAWRIDGLGQGLPPLVSGVGRSIPGRQRPSRRSMLGISESITASELPSL